MRTGILTAVVIGLCVGVTVVKMLAGVVLELQPLSGL